MAFRRKGVKHSLPLEETREEILVREIKDLKDQAKRVKMEQLDIFANVETPEGSSDESDVGIPDFKERDPPLNQILDENHQYPHLSKKAQFYITVEEMIQRMRSVRWVPAPSAPYAELYMYRSYRKNAVKKIKFMQSFIYEPNVAAALADDLFWQQLKRNNRYYTRYDDGRLNLHLLTAYYNYMDPEEEDIESDDEPQEEQADDVPPIVSSESEPESSDDE